MAGTTLRSCLNNYCAGVDRGRAVRVFLETGLNPLVGADGVRAEIDLDAINLRWNLGAYWCCDAACGAAGKGVPGEIFEGNKNTS